MQKDQKVRFTYLTGRLSAILIIPLEIAKKNGLKNPSYVIVEDTENGILIKKKKSKETYDDKIKESKD